MQRSRKALVVAAQQVEEQGTHANSRDSSTRAILPRTEDPRIRMGGQSERVPSSVAGERSAGVEPMNTVIPSFLPQPDYIDEVPPSDSPVPATPETITSYKGIALKDVGKDPVTGKVIPHKRSERVAKMVAYAAVGGYTLNDLAVVLNIRPGLLKKHYWRELQTGKDKVGMDLTAHAIKRAKHSDNILRFLLKSQFGWRDGEKAPIDSEVFNIHIHL